MQNKLFVGSLPWSTKDADLEELFSKAGTVLEAQVKTDRETGRSRGFGFVTMQTDAEAQKAIEILHNSQVDNRTITVNVARPKEPRSEGVRNF